MVNELFFYRKGYQVTSLTGATCDEKGDWVIDDGAICTDTNECLHPSLNKCEVICNNTVGGYTCSCPEGFVLTPDGFRCKGVH